MFATKLSIQPIAARAPVSHRSPRGFTCHALKGKELEKALEFQLRRSKEKRPKNGFGANKPKRQKATYETVLAETIQSRKHEARAWIEAWRSGDSKTEQLAADKVGLSAAAAINGNGIVVAETDGKAKGKTNGKTNGRTNGKTNGKKYSPDKIFEDGSLLFNSSSLLSVKFEEVLAV